MSSFPQKMLIRQIDKKKGREKKEYISFDNYYKKIFI